LRIVAAYLFLTHGTAKLLACRMSHVRNLQVLSLIGVAGILELVGGALLLIGLFTRRSPSSSRAKWPLRPSWVTSVAAATRWCLMLNQGELPSSTASSSCLRRSSGGNGCRRNAGEAAAVLRAA